VTRRTIDDVLGAAQKRLARVTPDEAWRRAQDGWLIVDTRSADDRRERGVIPGSVHAPLSVLEWRIDPTSGHQDPAVAGHEERLIVICADGYSSSLAALRLWEIGYADTTDVIGGIGAWIGAGLPLTRGGGGGR
jgi:rhodanese-related sulfurtransferase